MGQEKKPGKPDEPKKESGKPKVEGTFVFNPTKTTLLGGEFAEFEGELSMQKSERPIPEEVKRVDKERAKGAPQTPEAWYLAARGHLENGRKSLEMARKLISTSGNVNDIRNALLKAHFQWIDAADAFTRTSGFENQASLDETQRLIDKLGEDIATAQHQLAEQESRR